MRVFLRLLSFLQPFWWQIALAILLGCIMIVSNIALLGMAAYLIAATALGPLLVMLTLPIFIVRFASVSRSLSRYGERLLSHQVTFRLLAQLRTWFYNRLEPLAPAQLLTYRSGDVLARFVTDVEELQNVYLRVISPFIIAVVIAILIFELFAIFSLTLAWVALAFFVVAGLGIPLLTAILARGFGSQQVATRAELNMQIVDGIQGVQDILAYDRTDHHRCKIATLDQTLGHIQRRMARITGLQQALNDLLMNLALWTILILAIPLVVSKTINGIYLAFLSLVILASFEAIQPLAEAFQFIGHSLAAGERLFKVIDTTPQVNDPTSPLPQTSTCSTIPMQSITQLSEPTTPFPQTRRPRFIAGTADLSASVSVPRQSSTPKAQTSLSPPQYSPTAYTLEFDHIHFAYHPDEDNVLNEISFSIPPGSRIAVVGPSGSGKSTLMRLALRFWDPLHGTIRLNGQDIRNYLLNDLRGLIGIVAQDTYLFNDTIRGNLLLANPKASDDEIEQVLQQAQLAGCIAQFPDGLATWVGEHGMRLSGGERQRLAIARALLKNAPLLILDEATANLDPVTERAVLDALDQLMQGRTTLIMTHRLIAMERMDEILVLDSGQIIERGTHAQLLRLEGLYREMFELQNEMLEV